MSRRKSEFGVGSLAEYENFEQVGEGTYGYVFKAYPIQTTHASTSSAANASSTSGVGGKRGISSTVSSSPAPVALKKMIFQHKETAGFPICSVREIKMLKSLEHHNIVKLLDIISSKGCEHIDASIKQQTLKTTLQPQPLPQQKEGGGGGAKHDPIQENNKQDNKQVEKEASQPIFENLSNQLKRFGNLFMVFEYVDHDLGGIIDSRKFQFTQKQIKCIAKQLFDVLHYLDERKIVHRDIKSSNILIGNNNVIKLADFGLARSQHMDDEGRVLSMTNNVITMWYKPPELLLGAKRYSSAVDIWSASCVLAELELNRPLFPGKTEIDQIDLVFKGIGTPNEQSWPDMVSLPLCKDKSFMPSQIYKTGFYEGYKVKFSDVILDLLCRILIADPLKRLTAKDALNHAFVRDAKDPYELELLKVDSGASYHEFQTKQKRRQKQEEERIREANNLLLEEQAVSKLGHSISLPDPEPVHNYIISENKVAHPMVKHIVAPPILPPNNIIPKLSQNPPPPPPPFPLSSLQKNFPAVIEIVEIIEIRSQEHFALIGPEGSNIRGIATKTSTKIVSIPQTDSDRLAGKRRVEVRGGREDVKRALSIISETIKSKAAYKNVCFEFQNKGYCRNGDACQYAHVPSYSSGNGGGGGPRI